LTFSEVNIHLFSGFGELRAKTRNVTWTDSVARIATGVAFSERATIEKPFHAESRLVKQVSEFVSATAVARTAFCFVARIAITIGKVA
jgi:hypothetical protein